MTAPGQSTLDGNPNATPPITQGYRPTLDDGGALLSDDPKNPPNQATDPTSAAWNYFRAMQASLGKMIAVATFSLNAGAAPTFANWTTAANLINANPFQVSSRVSAGHYQITWTAGQFPLIGWPKAYLCAAGGAFSQGITAQYMTAPPAGTQGVEVWTTQAGVLTDLPFQVDLF